MPKGYFSTFLKQASRSELLHEATSAARLFTGVANKLDGEDKPKAVVNSKSLSIGQMYLFIYDAKWKEKLSYWDMHPLIFPIGISGDRFMGINMHYLPIGARVRLMDALYDFSTGSPDKDKLAISYGILKSASKYKYFKPCVHVYLNHYVRSTFMTIPSAQWKKALLLPTQKFTGPHAGRVYSDSVSKY
jgi:hypothetical protein